MKKRRRSDLEKLEKDLQAATDRVKGEAQQAAGRVKDEARQAADRVKGEAPRKAIHFASIIVPLSILYLPLKWVRLVLIVLAVAMLVTDLIKFHHPKIRSYFTEFFGHLIRRHEHVGIMGSTYMIIVSLLVTYLFDRDIAAASLIFLMVGDFMAAMVGKAWGRTKIYGNKTLEGFLGGFLASFLAAWLIVRGIPPQQLAAAALVAMVVEVWPIPVDDNFRIPLLSGLVLEWMR